VWRRRRRSCAQARSTPCWSATPACWSSSSPTPDRRPAEQSPRLAQLGGLDKLFALLLPPADAARIAAHGIALPVHGLTPAPSRGLAVRITGLSVAILIYIIIIYGIRITIGVCEEKSTRVVEVLLTTLRPVQLLVGKVFVYSRAILRSGARLKVRQVLRTAS
jgi:hypothetical protein